MRAPPCFRSSSIKSASPLRLALQLGLQQMMGFFVCVCVCTLVCINQFVFVVTAARCQCWWWVCSSLLPSSCCTSGESTLALKRFLMTFDPAPRLLLNKLDLDQTTNEQHPHSPSSLLQYHYKLDFYATVSVDDLHLHWLVAFAHPVSLRSDRVNERKPHWASSL